MSQEKPSLQFYGLTGTSQLVNTLKPCPLSDPELPPLPKPDDPDVVLNVRALEYAIALHPDLRPKNKKLFPLTCIICGNGTFMMIEGKDGCPACGDVDDTYVLRCSNKECKNHFHF
ncbi:hypothetical protein TWF718_005723 [Orbilia javanica]|uniref:Uncharacterized protein n=1 Tax=Orbilia javanica TaxID=47235 RepID=A0AAN8RJM3_9PEZI